jgi:peptidoglycan/xylan/chitin deacetylase (PgdA/CDA1 family)
MGRGRRAVRLLLLLLLVAACGSVLAPAPSPRASTELIASVPTWAPATSANAGPSSPPPAPSASPPPSPGAFPPLAKGVVPVLYYHRVQAAPPDYASWSHARRMAFLAYDTLPSAFVAQLDWLHDHGYTTILPRDLAAHWDTGNPLPGRPVILTFDDGFPSWVTSVLPALRERHMVAEFYLTLDAIKSKALSWSDVRKLAAGGNAIGAHDVHHVQLAGVPGKQPASATVMWHEINDIRGVIKANVGVVPDSMAYVGGGFDATLMKLVKKAGYTTARSIERGTKQRQADRFRLVVVRVGARDDVVDVATGAMADGLPAFTAKMAGTKT